MRFTQIEFILFFIFLLGCFFLVRENRARKIILLAASYYFYAYWDWRFLSLLMFATFSDFQIGKLLSKSVLPQRRRLLIAVSVLINLGMLAVFKYFNFFVSSLQQILTLSGMDIGTLSIILPLGISFYTFRTLSYTIDVFRHKIAPCNSLLDYAVFVSFFPTMVAGPIVRGTELLPQLQQPFRLELSRCLYGFRLFVVGIFLKVFVADGISNFTNYVFENVAVFNSLTIWLAAVGYSIQLYCDFAGYSMMAIGLAKAIGYDIPENFNFPYLSKSISEFWRRWHITLSNWIRDYVYISFGGNRKGKFRTYVNLLLAMALCGLWHGAAWTFVFWGFSHGLALVVHRIWQSVKKSLIIPNRFYILPFGSFFSRVITLVTVVFGWVFFRAVDFGSALSMFDKMLYPTVGVGWYHPFVLFIILSFALIHLVKVSGLEDYLELKPTAWHTPVTIFTMIWLCLVFGPKEFAPFIYSQF